MINRRDLGSDRPSVNGLGHFLMDHPLLQITAPEIRNLVKKIDQPERPEWIRAREFFLHTRNNYPHAADIGEPHVAVSACEVLRLGSALCFAKSALLVSLLRSAGIPAGFSYQILQSDDRRVLHGLVSASIDGRWIRLDPRSAQPFAKPVGDSPTDILHFPTPTWKVLREDTGPHASPNETITELLRAAPNTTAAIRALPNHLPGSIA